MRGAFFSSSFRPDLLACFFFHLFCFVFILMVHHFLTSMPWHISTQKTNKKGMWICLTFCLFSLPHLHICFCALTFTLSVHVCVWQRKRQADRGTVGWSWLPWKSQLVIIMFSCLCWCQIYTLTALNSEGNSRLSLAATLPVYIWVVCFLLLKIPQNGVKKIVKTHQWHLPCFLLFLPHPRHDRDLPLVGPQQGPKT